MAYPVSTIIPGSVPTGSIVILAAKRKTADKHRTIVMPELQVPQVPDKFRLLVVSSLYAAAREQLKEIWLESPGVAEVDEDLFTVDALLTFAARQAESKKLSGEKIAEELEEFLETINPARREDAEKILRSMAASNKAGSEKDCKLLAEKLEVWIDENAEDTDWVIHAVQRKLKERWVELRTQRLAYDDEKAAF